MVRNLLITLSIVAGLMLAPACTKKPKPEELSKLEESRQAAEAAEKKLTELRNERTQLEASLEAKKEELRKAEEERDAVKAKLGN